MKYTKYNMNAYNLHVINTDKFKTITISVSLRRKISKEEITIRNLLKELLINSSANYPSEKSLIIETEKLYDLKLLSSNYRIGNYAILELKTRFLNEKYTEKGMNEESIKFLLDILFKPKLDNDLDKCKTKIAKSIKSLSDDKVRYSLNKLLETAEDKPYSYNSYGYISDLEKITKEDIINYYEDIIKNDYVDIFVVGEIDNIQIKNIFREYFKLSTYHRNDITVVVPPLPKRKKALEVTESSSVNQTQLAFLYGINSLTDRERRYVLPIYGEMLGGSANSILFENVREKGSYAYYVNSIVKPYDNIMIIYSGIDGNNQTTVKKIIEKTLKDITKGNFSQDKFESAKKTLISSIDINQDNPVGIINNYYAMELVNSKTFEERIKQVASVTKDEVITVSKKINIYSCFVLEASNGKNNN